MMEMIPAVRYKVCILAPDNKYDEIKEQVSLFIGPSTFETDVYPFMLSHRDFDIYIIDMSYASFGDMREQFKKLVVTIQTHRASVFAFWSADTWKEFSNYSHLLTRSCNVAYCDTPDWCENLLCAISRITRFYNEESR